MGALRWLALLPGLLLTGAAMAADVNLAKPGGGSPSAWQGRLLGEVAAEGEVERVLLLRAVTSAPAELDLANVRRMLIENAAAPLQSPDAPEAPWRVRDGTWHALLLMRDGRVLELEIGAGGRDLRGCLRADDGASGCFDLVR